MPNNQQSLSFQAPIKMCQDIEYLVRELNHENLSNGSMLKTNKSEILRRIVTVGLNAEIRKLRERKIAELNAVVGNSGTSQTRGIEITNADITNNGGLGVYHHAGMDMGVLIFIGTNAHSFHFCYNLWPSIVS